MRTAIKLILLNLLIAQIIAPILVMIPCVIYLVATTGNLDKDTLITMLMIPAPVSYTHLFGSIPASSVTALNISGSGLAIFIS